MPNKEPDAKVFPVDSRFQQLARRPGGIPRAQAIERAQAGVDEIKQTFGGWFDKELQAIVAALPRQDSDYGNPGVWLDVALFHCRQLRDVGTTMGHELVTFIAGNFCEVLEAIKAGTFDGIDPERGRVVAIAEAAVRFAEAAIPERGKRRVVKPFGDGEIADANGYVIDHGSLLFRRRFGARRIRPASASFHHCRASARRASGMNRV